MHCADQARRDCVLMHPALKSSTRRFVCRQLCGSTIHALSIFEASWVRLSIRIPASLIAGARSCKNRSQLTGARRADVRRIFSGSRHCASRVSAKSNSPSTCPQLGSKRSTQRDQDAFRVRVCIAKAKLLEACAPSWPCDSLHRRAFRYRCHTGPGFFPG